MTMPMSPDHLTEAKIMTGPKTPVVFIHGLWLPMEACPVGEGSGLTGDEN
jgi:hypothetical protein